MGRAKWSLEVVCAEGAAGLFRTPPDGVDAGAFFVHRVPRGAVPAEAERALADWSQLRSRSGNGTHYNSPSAFVRALATSANPAADQPFLILVRGEDEIPRVAINGVFWIGPQIYKLGHLKIRSPKLRSAKVFETSILGDDPEALEVMVGLLRARVAACEIEILELKSVSVAAQSAFAQTGSGAIAPRFAHIDKLRWLRRLVDPVSGAPLEKRSAKSRKRRRQREAKLAECFGAEIECVAITRPEQTDAFATSASTIVAQTYQAALGIGVRDTVEYRALLRDLAHDGILRGYLLKGAGQPISYVVGTLDTGHFLLWALSFVPEYAAHSPGIVLLNRVIEEVSAEGAEVFDFGWGDASYKQRLGSECNDERDLRFYAASLRARLAHGLDRGVAGLRDGLRRALAASGRVDALRKRWREYIAR